MEKKALSDTDVGFYHVPDSGSRGTCTCKRERAFLQRWYFSLHILFPMSVIMVFPFGCCFVSVFVIIVTVVTFLPHT